MASVRRTLDHSDGVELEEISLEHDGKTVDQAYVVRTLRLPETWSFKSLSEARSRFDEEVTICRDDPFVQKRLGR
jgi:hypothetical protein